MASQIVATSGNKRLTPDQQAALNARLRHLPTMMAQQQARQQRAQDLKFRKQQFEQSAQQSKDTLAMQEKAQRFGAGVSAVNLGMGVNRMAQSNPGSFMNKGINDAVAGPGLGSSFGGIGNFNLGQGLTSGLVGFGASSMFGGGNKGGKGKKALIGAGAGALTGLLSGGEGFGGALGGALFGGLGGMFG